MAVAASTGAPFVVAHGAGNDTSAHLAALASGAPLVEADLRLRRGRVEVRHLKTVGPLPILWDRWTLVSRRRARLRGLADVLRTLPDSGLVLDLKGGDPRLVALVAAALREHPRAGPVVVCARDWRLLDALPPDLAVRRFNSVGSRRQLRRLRRRHAGVRLEGLSIHRKLLDAETVAELRGWVGTVMTWPVETPAEARTLLAWGVDGVITTSPAVMRDLGAVAA